MVADAHAILKRLDFRCQEGCGATLESDFKAERFWEKARLWVYAALTMVDAEDSLLDAQNTTAFERTISRLLQNEAALGIQEFGFEGRIDRFFAERDSRPLDNAPPSQCNAVARRLGATTSDAASHSCDAPEAIADLARDFRRPSAFKKMEETQREKICGELLEIDTVRRFWCLMDNSYPNGTKVLSIRNDIQFYAELVIRQSLSNLSAGFVLQPPFSHFGNLLTPDSDTLDPEIYPPQ